MARVPLSASLCSAGMGLLGPHWGTLALLVVSTLHWGKTTVTAFSSCCHRCARPPPLLLYSTGQAASALLSDTQRTIVSTLLTMAALVLLDKLNRQVNNSMNGEDKQPVSLRPQGWSELLADDDVGGGIVAWGGQFPHTPRVDVLHLCSGLQAYRRAVRLIGVSRFPILCNCVCFYAL